MQNRELSTKSINKPHKDIIMLKKALLSTLLSLSTIAAASINLDLNLTIKTPTNEQDVSGAVTLEENTPVSIVFNGLEEIIFDLIAQSENDMVTIQVQLLQKTENDELTEVTNQLVVQVPYGQPATITVNGEPTEEDNGGSLVLTIIPSLVE
jgi:flagellar basal body-associated protein FliL